MVDGTGSVSRRTFLSRGLGLLLAVPAAGALAALASCGDSSTQPAAPAAPPQPPAAAPAAPSQPRPVAPVAPPAAPGQAVAPADALVTEITASAGLVSALQYVNVSPIPDQRCEGCQLYTATGPEKGKCVLFQQGLVMAGGHCTSWVKKQA
jgi:hypothetical protein